MEVKDYNQLSVNTAMVWYIIGAMVLFLGTFFDIILKIGMVSIFIISIVLTIEGR